MKAEHTSDDARWSCPSCGDRTGVEWVDDHRQRCLVCGELQPAHPSPRADGSCPVCCPLNEHSGHVPEEDRSASRELVVPVRIELEASDLATVERLATLLEERRAEDARAARRAKRIVGIAVLNAILSIVVLALLVMGRWR